MSESSVWPLFAHLALGAIFVFGFNDKEKEGKVHP